MKTLILEPKRTLLTFSMKKEESEDETLFIGVCGVSDFPEEADVFGLTVELPVALSIAENGDNRRAAEIASNTFVDDEEVSSRECRWVRVRTKSSASENAFETILREMGIHLTAAKNIETIPQETLCKLARGFLPDRNFEQLFSVLEREMFRIVSRDSIITKKRRI